MAVLESPIVHDNADELENIRLSDQLGMRKLLDLVRVHVDSRWEIKAVIYFGSAIICLIAKTLQTKNQVVWHML